jgi:hypothetical protein
VTIRTRNRRSRVARKIKKLTRPNVTVWLSAKEQRGKTFATSHDLGCPLACFLKDGEPRNCIVGKMVAAVVGFGVFALPEWAQKFVGKVDEAGERNLDRIITQREALRILKAIR